MAPATKATQKRLEASVASFNGRYRDTNQWGQDRWNRTLYPALTKSTTYCAILNQYAVTEEEGKIVISGTSDGDLNKVDLPTLIDSPNEQYPQNEKNQIICFEQAVSIPNVEKQLIATKSVPLLPFPVPKPANAPGIKLFTHWNMDAASVLAAHMLDVQPGERVLDMCAAPGGKSVVLAQKLFPQLHCAQPTFLPPEDLIRRSSIVVNELDPVRYKRLAMNLKLYLPECLFPTPEIPQAPVKILNKDLSTKSSASSLPYGIGGYDKVLIDAPCSSERHIIHAYERAKASGQVAEEMLNWKSSHVATLVKIQTGLLQTALKAIKVGGKIVYATCALGFEENDGVIEKVLDNLKAERMRAKRDGLSLESWEVQLQLGNKGVQLDIHDPVLQRMTESTTYGRIALPDHGLWGPLYFSVLIKVEKAKKTRSKTATVHQPDQLNTKIIDPHQEEF